MYLTEFQLNKANSFDTEASFLVMDVYINLIRLFVCDDALH